MASSMLFEKLNCKNMKLIEFRWSNRLSRYGNVSAVFDPVGGRYGEAAFRALGQGGRYVVFGFAAGGTDPKSAFPQFPINRLLMKGQQILG